MATESTPSEGSDYALSAYMVGGATLDASVTPLLPALGESVEIQAKLTFSASPIALDQATAKIRNQVGEVFSIPLTIDGNSAQATWETNTAGLHAFDIYLSGLTSDGIEIGRTAFLSIEVQPKADESNQTRFLFFIEVGLIVVVLICILLSLVYIGKLLRRK
jgi:hypothetical protein